MQTAADIIEQNILARRSFKVAMLQTDPVDRALVARVVEAARWAPSHGQTEPWRLTIYTGEARAALGRAFSETYRAVNEPAGKFQQAAFESQRDRVWQAPVWIGIGLQPGVDANGKLAMPEWEEISAVASAVQNMHLMAQALSLGAQWTSNPIATHPRLAEFMGLTPPGRSLGFFFLGHVRPDIASPVGKRRPAEERIRWVEASGT